MTVERIYVRPQQTAAVNQPKLSPRAKIARQLSTTAAYISHKLKVARCVVPSPQSGSISQKALQQDYFHALSQDRLDVFGALNKLGAVAEDIEIQGPNKRLLDDGQKDLDNVQLLRLAKNFRSFGRAGPVFQEVITALKGDGRLNDGEAGYLKFLETIEANIAATQDMIEVLGRDRKIDVAIKVDTRSGDDQRLLRRALMDAWDRLKREPGLEPREIIAEALDKAVVESARRSTSTRARRLREEAASIRDTWNDFKRTGKIDADMLQRLLTQALHRRGFHGLANRSRAAGAIVDRLLSRERTLDQAKLLLPLLKAMHARLIGTEGHKSELRETIENIRPNTFLAKPIDPEEEVDLGSYNEYAEPTPVVKRRDLASETDLEILRFELHDIAKVARNRSQNDEGFRNEVQKIFLDQNLGKEDARLILERAQALDLGGRSRIVRDVLSELVQNSYLGQETQGLGEAGVSSRKYTDSQLYRMTVRDFFERFGNTTDYIDQIEIHLNTLERDELSAFHEFFTRHEWLFQSDNSDDPRSVISEMAWAFRAFSLEFLLEKFDHVPDPVGDEKPIDGTAHWNGLSDLDAYFPLEDIPGTPAAPERVKV